MTREEQSTRRKISPNATLSITNPIWIGVGLNPRLGDEKPVVPVCSRGRKQRNWSQFPKVILEGCTSRIQCSVAFECQLAMVLGPRRTTENFGRIGQLTVKSDITQNNLVPTSQRTQSLSVRENPLLRLLMK